MGSASRASLILQGDTKAAETAHNKAAGATGRARLHGGDLPGLSHAADKETGTRLGRRAAAVESRVVLSSYRRETIVKFIFVSLSSDSGEQREAVGGDVGEAPTLKVTCTANFPGAANRRVATHLP